MSTLLATAIAAALLGAEDTPEYRWPLDLPRVLTSSFAEYRAARFHMGIDLRTGPIGQNVFAAADGYVSRIRCSPFGYGKAVYLTLDDGNSIVYAHLDDFAPALRDYVRAAQHARRSYTVDLTPNPREFPVARGELIARSGQTGIGVPHLHYEIRDPSGQPLNPRLIGVDWPDTTPPIVRGLLIVPLDAAATIDGDVLPKTFFVRAAGANAFTTDPVFLAGTVGFAVDTVDPANGGDTRLGVRSIETRAGDTVLFRLSHDRVSYETGNDGAIAYHPHFLDKGRFLAQYRSPGNDLEMYAQSPADGRFSPAPAHDAVTIAIRDFHDNQAVLTIPLRHETAEFLAAPVAGQGGTGTVTFDTYGEGLIVSAQFSAPEETSPILAISAEDLGTQSTPFRRIDSDTFRAVYAPVPRVADIVVRVEHPRVDAAPQRFLVVQRRAPARRIQWGAVGIVTSPDTPYGALFIKVQESDHESTTALTAWGRAYTLWPNSAPIDGPIILSFPVPDGAANPARLRLYQRNGRNWSVESAPIENGRFTVSTRSLGTFAVFEDTAKPTIQVLDPPSGLQSADLRPKIRARIADQGSGIASWSLTANGQWLLAAYDPEEGLVSWEQDEDLSGQTLEIVFYVTDASGNAATAARTLERPPAP